MSRNSVITLPRPSLSIPFQRTFPATKENSYNWDHHNGHQGPLKYCQNTQQNILNPFIPSCTNPPMATERAGVCHLATGVGPAQLNIVICLSLNTHTHTQKRWFFSLLTSWPLQQWFSLAPKGSPPCHRAAGEGWDAIPWDSRTGRPCVLSGYTSRAGYHACQK